MLAAMDPAPLSPAMLGAALPFLFEHGTDAQIAAYAAAWLKTKPPVADPRWLPADSARLRTLAADRPEGGAGGFARRHRRRGHCTRSRWPFRDRLARVLPARSGSISRVQQLGFGLGDTEEGRLAAIRARRCLPAERRHQAGHREVPVPPSRPIRPTAGGCPPRIRPIR